MEWKGKKMLDDDRFEEMYQYVRRTHRWVVFIGVFMIMGIVLSVCGALFTSA